MKPVRSILSKEFVYTDAANTDIRKTFEIVRCGGTNCPTFWGCRQRGCYQLAKERYGEQVVQLEPRPEHDLGPDGKRLKAGK
jgi:hypothetical protein